MYDIHYHLLFGVDDGPRDIETSVAMAEASIAEGVTHIVCTPHANSVYAFKPEENRERVTMLNKRLGGRITLGLGCDFHLSLDNVEDAYKNPRKYTINAEKYLLVEFPETIIAHDITDVLCRFVAEGTVPIITHPERNAVLQRDPERMLDWMGCGCLVQITAASLNGRFGARAEAMSWELIRKNWVQFVASDAHSLTGRPPAMRDAYDRIEKEFGQTTADLLCIHNPRAVFLGEPLTAQPQPIGTMEGPKPPKRGLWKSLFGG